MRQRPYSCGKTHFSPPPPTPHTQVLVDLGPAFVKIGQALSSRPDVLPPEYIDELELLQVRLMYCHLMYCQAGLMYCHLSVGVSLSCYR